MCVNTFWWIHLWQVYHSDIKFRRHLPEFSYTYGDCLFHLITLQDPLRTFTILIALSHILMRHSAMCVPTHTKSHFDLAWFFSGPLFWNSIYLHWSKIECTHWSKSDITSEMGWWCIWVTRHAKWAMLTYSGSYHICRVLTYDTSCRHYKQDVKGLKYREKTKRRLKEDWTEKGMSESNAKMELTFKPCK